MNTENMSENIKELIITLYKTLVYAILLFTFMFVMRRANYALWQPTRTSAVTAGSFAIVLMLMQSIYGNFEIGHKKSKPVFLNSMISVLIADLVAAITMILMGIIQFPLPQILIPTFLFGLLTYLLQALVMWITAHLGNDLYFYLHKPANTLIINMDDKLTSKIRKYVHSHDKQFNVVKEIETIDLSEIEHNDISVIYALGNFNESLTELVNYCYRHDIHLIYNVDFYDILHGKKDTYVIDDVLMLEIAPNSLSLIQLVTKRTIDIIGSLVLLILSSPIYIFVYIAIKKDDGGPVFYLQERLTKHGKTFKIIKFRSMKMNAGSTPVTENDGRITKVGHIIRNLRIDELPQAINILKGDISLVGPRPESLSHSQVIQKTVPDFDLRLKVKGGLTGYAQIFGKYNTSPEAKLLLDLKYIENYSIIEDIKLILQTLMVFIRPDSTEAFAEEE